MTIPHKDSDRFSELFNHSYLDMYGLDASTFRVLAHLARRKDEYDEAWPSISSTAEICKLSRQTVINSIRTLEELNIITARRTFGRKTRYTLNPRSKWKPPPSATTKKPKKTSAQNGPVSEIDPSIPDTAPVPEIDRHPSKPSTLRLSREGNPLKDNTVSGRFSDPRQVMAQPALPPNPPLVPNGSPPDDGHAVLRNRNGATGVIQRNADHATDNAPQSPIERKAYAIAAQLQRRHWDNCKVFFAKQTARAYAKGALLDGHDQHVIIKTYDTTLHYCHRLTTDEICRGERHQGEKATPALTVWLARDRLSGDSRTVEDRWKVVIARLTTEKRKQIEEEARIREEIAAKAPEIEAWFANKSRRNASVGILEAKPELVAA